jgi:hypothetical protein
MLDNQYRETTKQEESSRKRFSMVYYGTNVITKYSLDITICCKRIVTAHLSLELDFGFLGIPAIAKIPSGPNF